MALFRYPFNALTIKSNIKIPESCDQLGIEIDHAIKIGSPPKKPEVMRGIPKVLYEREIADYHLKQQQLSGLQNPPIWTVGSLAGDLIKLRKKYLDE
jgi:hypothetical protein